MARMYRQSDQRGKTALSASRSRRLAGLTLDVTFQAFGPQLKDEQRLSAGARGSLRQGDRARVRDNASRRQALGK